MRIIERAGEYTTPSEDEATHYVEHLRVPDLSVGTYSIPAGNLDDQTPHTEDEIYLVTTGTATISTQSGSARVGPGDVIYIPAGERHQFVDIAADLTLLVLFAPAFESRA